MASDGPIEPAAYLLAVEALKYVERDAESCRALWAWATGEDDHATAFGGADPSDCGHSPLALDAGDVRPGDWLVKIGDTWAVVPDDQFGAAVGGAVAADASAHIAFLRDRLARPDATESACALVQSLTVTAERDGGTRVELHHDELHLTVRFGPRGDCVALDASGPREPT